jgi:hypothetical protein
MVYDIGLAARFASIGALEEMTYSALAWWAPCAKSFARAARKGHLWL